jgi:membrane protease YdiL (CAAX protease family)
MIRRDLVITGAHDENKRHFSPRTATLIGIGIALAGLAWSLLANMPQQHILTAYPADWSMALYFAVEHIPTEIAFLFAILLFVYAARRSGVTLSFGLRRFPLWTLLALLPCMVVIVTGNMLWQGLVLPVLGYAPAGADNAFADWWVHDRLTFITLTAIYAVIAPPFEELLFRGILFQWLVLKRGTVIALVVSSIIFAVVHVDMVGVGGYIGLAVCSALLFKYGRSIWPCIVLHAAMNSLYIVQSTGLVLR